LLLALIAAVLLLLLLSPKAKNGIEQGSTPFLATALALPARAAGVLRESWNSLGRLRTADQENQRLKKELALAVLERGQLEERLRRQAASRGEAWVAGRLYRPVVEAHLLARDPSTWFNSITLDKGSADGVRVGAGVITPEGVAGKVVSVTGSTSKMVFVLDPSCRLAVRVARSKVAATLAGSGRRSCVLQYLSGQDDVVLGDLIETASEGSIFPAGVPVGQVVRVEKRDAGLNLFAEVKPLLKPSQVQTLFVVGGRP
jgi:rod shape-determining protein MreC